MTRYASAPHPELEILSCRSDKAFSPHLHEGYVVWLNSEAGEQFSVQGSTEILQPGSISIIEPGVIHANQPCLAQQRHLRSFYFTPQFLADIAERSDGALPRKALPTSVIRNRQLWGELANLHGELLLPSDHFHLEVETYQVFSSILMAETEAGKSVTQAGDEWRVKKVLEYFVDNIAGTFSLPELAALVSCTEFHLIRLFKKYTGLAPHGYLLQLRLEHARRLLNQNYSIVNAALLSGFADQSHLTRHFSKRYGVTPGVYRRSSPSR